MLRQYKLRDYRFSLVLWVVALSTLGIMIIGSAQKASQTKQIFGLILGLVCMVAVSLIDYTWLINFYWIYYVAGIGLLMAVLLFGVEVNGAKRCKRGKALDQYRLSVSTLRCGKDHSNRVFCQAVFQV